MTHSNNKPRANSWLSYEGYESRHWACAMCNVTGLSPAHTRYFLSVLIILHCISLFSYSAVISFSAQLHEDRQGKKKGLK